jgi:hypothetical protein
MESKPKTVILFVITLLAVVWFFGGILGLILCLFSIVEGSLCGNVVNIMTNPFGLFFYLIDLIVG